MQVEAQEPPPQCEVARSPVVAKGTVVPSSPPAAGSSQEGLSFHLCPEAFPAAGPDAGEGPTPTSHPASLRVSEVAHSECGAPALGVSSL